ncbi:unnamed protein product [Ectocarpus sp. 4 AP-2014]
MRPGHLADSHHTQNKTQQQQQAGHTVEVHGGRRRRCGQRGGTGCSFVWAPLLGPDYCSGRIRNDNLAGANNLCSVTGAAPYVIENPYARTPRRRDCEVRRLSGPASTVGGTAS